MSQSFVILLRGVNVGGKNRLPMAELASWLEQAGCSQVTTYIASGNVIVSSDRGAVDIKRRIEAELPQAFQLDSQLIKVLILTESELQAVVGNRPPGFGDQPGTYHSDVIFMIDIPVEQALPYFDPRPGVDAIWPGPGVVYSQRLSAERTKSRLGKIIASPVYGSLTVRNWNTTLALQRLLQARS